MNIYREKGCRWPHVQTGRQTGTKTEAQRQRNGGGTQRLVNMEVGEGSFLQTDTERQTETETDRQRQTATKSGTQTDLEVGDQSSGCSPSTPYCQALLASWLHDAMAAVKLA